MSNTNFMSRVLRYEWISVNALSILIGLNKISNYPIYGFTVSVYWAWNNIFKDCQIFIIFGIRNIQEEYSFIHGKTKKGHDNLLKPYLSASRLNFLMAVSCSRNTWLIHSFKHRDCRMEARLQSALFDSTIYQTKYRS